MFQYDARSDFASVSRYFSGGGNVALRVCTTNAIYENRWFCHKPIKQNRANRMPYFISYSHQDKDFVDKLAIGLALKRRHVWVDRWELKVGDSILSKVQEALTDASGLIIVLSKASVTSEWCKKELTAGLLRELEEKHVVVLPVLLEDCAIPLFLRDKLYADFRKDFGSGLKVLLDATASVTADTMARGTDEEFFHDWAIDWNASPTLLMLNLTCASFYKKHPFSVLTQIEIRGEEAAAKKFRAYESHGLGSIGRAVILTSCVEFIDPNELQLLIHDDEVAKRELCVQDIRSSLQYAIVVRCRRLGDDSGKDVLYDYGTILRLARDTMLQRSRKVEPHELAAILAGKMA
jgi:hypothetical protein